MENGLPTMTVLGIILLIFTVSCKSSVEKRQSPNVIVVLADDLGYRDLGCYGGKAKTPNLDKLAKSGLRFTNFYAAAPNCSPSRTGYLTGKLPSIAGMYNYRPPGHPMHLHDQEITIAEILKNKGYKTGHFGKWHLSNLTGEQGQPGPLEQGFEFYFATENNAEPSHKNPVNFIKNGKEIGKIDGFSCQIVIEEAMAWLQSTNVTNNPFFLNISFHEPHKKIASPPQLIQHYPSENPFDAKYFANIENLDSAFGKLYKYLYDQNLLENTFIVFASDNGSYRNGSNGELRALKSYVYEGGIRIPGIISWSKNIQPGVEHTPAGLIDLFPTISGLTGASGGNTENLHGKDLTPLWSDNPFIRKSPLSWFFYRTTPQFSVRIGDYSILGIPNDTIKHSHSFAESDMKYIQTIQIDSFEAYNLSHDVTQDHPITDFSIPEIQNGITHIKSSLESIQKNGRYWNGLPKYEDSRRKSKKDWVPYNHH